MKRLLIIVCVTLSTYNFSMDRDGFFKFMIQKKMNEVVPCELCSKASQDNKEKNVELYLVNTYCQGNWQRHQQNLISANSLENAIRRMTFIENTRYAELEKDARHTVLVKILQEARENNRDDVVVFVQANLNSLLSKVL